MDCRSPKRARRLALVVTLNCVSNGRASDVRKGLRSNPLARDISQRGWWAMQGSNLRPLPCEGRNRAGDPL